MKDFRLDVDPANVDPDGLCDNNASSITQLLIDGALAAGEDLNGLAAANSSASATVTLDAALVENGIYTDYTGTPRHIYILDAGSDSQTGATYTLIGTDANYRIITETLTGPGSGLFVISALRYHTITSIAIASPVSGSTIDVGVTGHFTSADGLAHRLDIIDTSTQDQSDSVFTITGTDADGKAQTEAVTGPGSGATVESTKYFLTVSNITQAGGDASDTVDIGTVDEIAARTIPLDWYASEAAVAQLDISGTISVDIQVTVQNPFQDDAAPFDLDDQEDYAWINDANFTAETADIINPLSMRGLKAMRIVTNSYTNTAEVQVYVSQPRGRR